MYDNIIEVMKSWIHEGVEPVKRNTKMQLFLVLIYVINETVDENFCTTTKTNIYLLLFATLTTMKTNFTLNLKTLISCSSLVFNFLQISLKVSIKVNALLFPSQSQFSLTHLFKAPFNCEVSITRFATKTRQLIRKTISLHVMSWTHQDHNNKKFSFSHRQTLVISLSPALLLFCRILAFSIDFSRRLFLSLLWPLESDTEKKAKENFPLDFSFFRSLETTTSKRRKKRVFFAEKT